LEPRARGIGESRKPVATQIEQIDVGHGDATLVISAPTQNQATLAAGLIDTGRGSGLGDIQWLDLLASRGLRKIAWIALTHLDEDHTGGLKKLAALVPIDCVALPLPYLRTKKASQLLKLVLKQGTQIRDWNSGCIPYPTRVLGDAQKLGVPNGIMGAVWIPLAQGGFYLSAGDARREEEFTLGKWAASLADQSWVQPQDPRILKISHHGSKTSTTPEFLKWVRPSEAWISVGAGNAYGHPAPLVLNNLLRLGIRIRRTDRDGLLSLKSRR
jgi:competence protein ComEC